MKKRFIVILPNGFSQYTFSDLQDDNRVIAYKNTVKDLQSNVIRLIRRIHLNSQINSIINLPFKSIWSYELNDIKWKDNEIYYIVFIYPFPIKASYLVSLRNKYNIKYILYADFVWGNNSYMRRDEQKYASEISYDYMFSFDPQNAKEYGFIYYPIPYSIISKNQYYVEYDLYLIANTKKGRLNELQDIYEYLSQSKASHKYRLSQVPRNKRKFNKGIIYNKKIPYSEAVEEVKKSNCILEFLEKGQSGATLRYYEAVCYNKKLLTNNKNVVNLPFYNPDYIHIFEKPEDIDWNWVKERIPVDYHYDGRFSPTHLIDKIIELEEEKERNELGKVETD